ncbi:MAG: hypothetical protein Q3988_05625 [Gemella sp.]|nr:hypothetical protein [Gemella sp.]
MLKKYREIKRTLAKLHYIREQDKDFILSQGVFNYGQIKVKSSLKNHFADRVDKIIDTTFLTRAKLKELAHFKSDLEERLTNYHNETFKAIIRLYVFDNLNINKIAKRYRLKYHTVNNIIDLGLKQIYNPTIHRDEAEYESELDILLYSSTLDDDIIQQVESYINKLNKYDYNCLINCYRDMALTVQEVATIHNKKIWNVALNIERMKDELIQLVPVEKRCIF